MANLFRLILAGILLLVSVAASASFTGPTTGYYDANYNGNHFTGASSLEACGKAAAANNDQLLGADSWASLGTCLYKKAGGGQYNYITVLSCPANSSDAGGNNQCYCKDTYVEKTVDGVTSCELPACPNGQIRNAQGVCVVGAPPPDSCTYPNELVNGKCLTQELAFCTKYAGTTDVSREVTLPTNAAPTSICVPTIYEGPYGCASTFEREFGAKLDNGKWVSRGTATLSAVMCNLVENAVGTDPVGSTPETAAPTGIKAECPSGQPGQVNGVTVCIPYPTKNGVVTDSNGKTITTNPDGSKVEEGKANSTTCNSAGICTVTTTTTTTTTAINGSVSTQQSSSTQSIGKGAYCATAAGKADSACTGTVTAGGGSGNGSGNGGGDGSFSGSCTSDFQCSGDAVQCATARATWKTYCEASTLDASAKAGIATAMAKAGTDQSSGLDMGTTTLSATAFDQTDAIGGASCSIDKTVQVMGQTLVLPLSVICPYLQYAGFALVAVSLIGAALIVFKT